MAGQRNGAPCVSATDLWSCLSLTHLYIYILWIVPGWHHSFHFQFVLVILSRSPPSCPRVSNSTVCDCRQLSAQGAKRRVGFEVSCQPLLCRAQGATESGTLGVLFVGWLASSAFSVWTLGLTPLLEGKRRDTECCTLGSAHHSVCWPFASYLRIFTGKRYEFHIGSGALSDVFSLQFGAQLPGRSFQVAVLTIYNCGKRCLRQPERRRARVSLWVVLSETVWRVSFLRSIRVQIRLKCGHKR